MKDLLKKLFNLIGLEISKKRANENVVSPFDSVFMPIRNNIFSCFDFLKDKGFYPSVIIDVGVADGTPELTNAFENAYFIWIEPLIEFEDILKKLSQKYTGEYHLCAAGKESGKMILNVHEDLAGSSLFNEIDGKTADGATREISIIKLDSIVGTEMKKNILIKIDAQGAELEVLEGSKDILLYTEVVVLEVSMFKFQYDAPDFYQVIVYMKEKGFVVYDLFPGHNRPLDNALAQVDLVFVKENGQFRTSHNWATNEQRRLINNLKVNSRLKMQL